MKMIKCTIERRDRIEIKIRRKIKLRGGRSSLRINRLRFGPRKNLQHLRDSKRIATAIIILILLLILHQQHRTKAEWETPKEDSTLNHG